MRVDFEGRIKNRTLRSIGEKVLADVPVTEAEALYMLGTDDILELGVIADCLRRKINADVAYYAK